MRTLGRFTAVTVVAGAAFAAGCASAPAPRTSTGPTVATVATGPTDAAQPTTTPTQAFVDRPPSPIAGTWRVTCPENDGMLVEFTVNGNEAVGKVVDPGAAKRYGFVKGEEVFRLTADSYGDWVGKTRWRSVTGAQHWDPIRFSASADTLTATMTNEPCYRNMPKRR
jgi:hypothetical protein